MEMKLQAIQPKAFIYGIALLIDIFQKANGSI